MNTDEAVSFLESLPVPAKPIARNLRLSMYSKDELRRAVQALARQGLIGCLPFADDGPISPTRMVIRLLPARDPRDCPISDVHNFQKMPRTLAPALKHFVASRLADLSGAPDRFSARRTKELLDYASSLGSAESTKVVLAARQRTIRRGTWRMTRDAILWAALGEFDPLFEILGAAWMYDQKELVEWLGSLRGEKRSHPVVDRLSIGYHTHYKTGEDMSEPAWRIVYGDHVFDFGYTGILDTSVLRWHLTPLYYAVKFLREQGVHDQRMDSPVWDAAQAAADNRRYGGELHFEAARAMAADDAAGAYTHLANAARHAYRGSNRSLRPQILDFAQDLAAANQWHVLAATLKLAQPASRARASSRAKTARRPRKES